MSLKLYVWRGDGVLEDYTSGMAVALAYDAEQARAMLRKEIDLFEESMQFLLSEPEVFEAPVAISVHGGG